MRIKTKVMVSGSWVDFEVEVSLAEISHLDKTTDTIKQCLIKLAKD